jgi:hypothetical protein
MAQPASFEGLVAYKLTGKGGATEMTQMYKGTKSPHRGHERRAVHAMIMDGRPAP